MSIPYLRLLSVLLFILLNNCQFQSTSFLWESPLAQLLNYSDTTTFYLFTLGKPAPVVADTLTGFLSLKDSIGSWVQFQMEGVQCEIFCFPDPKQSAETGHLRGITVKFFFNSYKEAITGYQLCMETLWERLEKAPEGHFGHHYWKLENQVVHLYLFDLRPMVVLSYALR